MGLTTTFIMENGNTESKMEKAQESSRTRAPTRDYLSLA